MHNKRLAVILGVAAFVLPLIIYSLTLCRTVGFVDAGELCVVSRTLGIAHPTGYPLYTLLGRLFSLIPLGSVVVRTNFMSAFFAALSTFILFITISRILASEGADPTRSRLLAFFCASSFAFSTTIWNQAVVTEVYSLTTFLISVLIFLTFSDDQKAPLLFAYTLGLALSNHMGALLVGIPCGIYILGVRKETLKKLPLMIVLFFLGLSIYAYLPIRAHENPVMNWGNASTLERFIWHVSGKQYRVWMFSSELQVLKVHLIQFGRLALDQFTPFLLWLPLLGIFAAKKSKKVYLILAIFFLDLLYSLNYDIPDIDAYYIPAFMIMAVVSGFGLRFLFRKTTRKAILLLGAFVFLIPIGAHYYKCDMSRNRIAYEYGENHLKSIENNGLCLTNNWDIYSPILYIQHIEGKRRDVVMIDKELLRRSWYFDYLERQSPRTFNLSKPEIESYLEELYKFEHGTLRSPVEIQRRFIRMVNSFINNQMKTGRAYTTFINGHDVDAREIGRDLEKIPYGTIFEFREERKQRIFDYGSLNLKSSFSARTYRDERTRHNLEIYPRMMLSSGIGMMNEGLYVNAKRAFESVLSVEEDNLPATLHLGGSQFMLGQYEEAIEKFEKVLRVEPNNQLAMKGLAAARSELQEK
ncbi:DUF2723 domain-containing protein [candidate division TA06 bacterium]|uniref:DUF2723 domain-containing protein n=1 Tax=candidate division TA06 bacterium TaxID=2250710 RepID=A0A523UMQ4_UNCT6|nr:MAG: DUF2723 domain-containing protein [candidate division TA06 bacterium]